MIKPNQLDTIFRSAVIALLLAVLLASMGCTWYRITNGQEDGKQTSVQVISWRKFEQPRIVYTRDGEAAGFQFGAESVDSTEPVDAAIRGAVTAAEAIYGRDGSQQNDRQ